MRDVANIGWETRPLGDLVDVLDRLRKPITKKDRKAGPYPYYGATGVLDHVEGYLFDEPLVLIGEDGAKWEAGANSAFAIEGKTWVNNHAHVLRPHRDQVLDDWLIYYLNGADLMPFISGMTVPKLNQGRLREIPIPVPTPEEQQRIVEALDEAFEGLTRARTHAEANLQNAQDLFEQAEVKLFKDVSEDATQTTLGQLATFRNGLNYSRSSQGAEVKVVGVGDFQDNFTVPTETLARTKIDGQLGEDDKLVAGDILAVRSNGNRDLIGRTMLMPEPEEPISFSGFTIRVRLNNRDVLPEYVCSFLRTKASRAKLTAGGGGANISNLNQRILSAFPIYFPDRTRQNETLTRLKILRDQRTRLANDYTAKIKNIDDLRQSLLQKAFAGELT